MKITNSTLAILALVSKTLAGDILKTDSFTNCLNNSSITVNKMNIQFDRSTNMITFDITATSEAIQNVTANLVVSAYGVQAYQNSFDPCVASSFVPQLCPVPVGTFSAKGSQSVPKTYASQIPSIAYTIPDLEGGARLELKHKNGEQVACIQSTINNGKSVDVPAVGYAAAGIAAAALALSALGAIAAGGNPGTPTPSPSFGEVIGWFQGLAMNGMLSVQYPTVYRSFTKNFAFSTGIIPWGSMQNSIDGFRKSTGGNLTHDNYPYLQNTTLIYSDTSSANSSIIKRGVDIVLRSVDTTVNGTASRSGSTSGNSTASHVVYGIQAYVETLTVPQSNTFMTVLLYFAILVATTVVGILLFKVILEVWAMFTKRFPQGLSTFRKTYWVVTARTVVNLILLLYGIWVLYCVFQFIHGDSWAAKVLAGITLVLFTAILGFYSYKIWRISHRHQKLDGDNAALYEDKSVWIKYHIFYDSFKRGYWWLFVPEIVYMAVKGIIVAAAVNHGIVQGAGQLIVESIMLILLLWTRPYTLKSGNWINVIIQIVRILSVALILVFAAGFGVAQATKTVTAVVLIAVQGSLTAILALLIAVNSIIVCFRENPHRKRRKEAERLSRMAHDLTPFDYYHDGAMLLTPQPYMGSGAIKKQQPMRSPAGVNNPAFEPFRGQGTPRPGNARLASDEEDLVGGAAGMGKTAQENRSPTPVGR